MVLSKLLEYFVACAGSYMTFLYSGIVHTIVVMLPDLLQLSLVESFSFVTYYNWTYIYQMNVTLILMIHFMARFLQEKMRELQEQAISDGRSYIDIDILHQVLGPKPGYVRGLG